MDKSNRIFVAGHKGMLSSAVVRRRKKYGLAKLLFDMISAQEGNQKK
jgi:hypothetical protein